MEMYQGETLSTGNLHSGTFVERGSEGGRFDDWNARGVFGQIEEPPSIMSDEVDELKDKVASQEKGGSCQLI